MAQTPLDLYDIGLSRDMRAWSDATGWHLKTISPDEVLAAANPEFIASVSDSAVAGAGGESVLGIETGDDPVEVQELEALGEFISGQVQVFTGSTFTGGTTVNTFSGNDITVIAPTFDLTLNPTVTQDGSAFSPLKPVLGLAGILTKANASSGKLKLKPNTKYIFKVTNSGLAAIATLIYSIRLVQLNG